MNDLRDRPVDHWPVPVELARPLLRCRICQTDLYASGQIALDLGPMRLNDFPDSLKAVELTPRVPLIVIRCAACGLHQLLYTVNPDRLYRDNYWYRSGINETMVQELRDVVQHGIDRVRLETGDHVLDIGANDGTLLRQYAELGHAPKMVAFEPSDAVFPTLQERLPEGQLFHGFFPPSATWATKLRFRVITSIAMFYDLPDPTTFVEAIKQILHPEGVWIVQFQDLQQMLAAKAFDNVCFEHLEYYTLDDVQRLVNRYGLEVYECERRAINGGSLRLTIRHQFTGRSTKSVSDQLLAEETVGLTWLDPEIFQLWSLDRGDDLLRSTWSTFRQQISEMRKHVRTIVETTRAAGGVIDLYGASTKGNTLLQVFGLTGKEIRYAWERAPEKWGRYTVTGIPIIAEEIGRDAPPQLLLTTIWQYRDHILEREREFLQGGGRILFPLPHAEIAMAKGGAGV